MGKMDMNELNGVSGGVITGNEDNWAVTDDKTGEVLASGFKNRADAAFWEYENKLNANKKFEEDFFKSKRVAPIPQVDPTKRFHRN